MLKLASRFSKEEIRRANEEHDRGDRRIRLGNSAHLIDGIGNPLATGAVTTVKRTRNEWPSGSGWPTSTALGVAGKVTR